ncbi:MAG TPA: zinc-ribbon domain-containing protein, partial [Polyangiales bacterium]|nr:zinc-ribbon domain-containing protein [Polyangiales bacterium]
MQLFACDNCHAPIFFDNYRCTNCGFALAFLPDLRTMSALEPLPEAQASDGAPAPVGIAPADAVASPDGASAPIQQSQDAAQQPAPPVPAPVVHYKALAASGRTYR